MYNANVASLPRFLCFSFFTRLCNERQETTTMPTTLTMPTMKHNNNKNSYVTLSASEIQRHRRHAQYFLHRLVLLNPYGTAVRRPDTEHFNAWSTILTPALPSPEDFPEYDVKQPVHSRDTGNDYENKETSLQRISSEKKLVKHVEIVSTAECRQLIAVFQTRLPRELRNHVYQWLVHTDEYFIESKANIAALPPKRISLSSLSTTRRKDWGIWKVNPKVVGESFYHEILEHWYRHTTFRFRSPFTLIPRFLDKKAYDHSTTIRELVGNVYCCIHTKVLFKMLKHGSPRLDEELANLDNMFLFGDSTKVQIYVDLRGEWDTKEANWTELRQRFEYLWPIFVKAMDRSFLIELELIGNEHVPNVQDASPESWVKGAQEFVDAAMRWP
ncbi:hypothetical protein CC86DRAFT_41131 [Ophiobolus disseminans]|uniref:Uncharacterized protein n=1 Tax=Ophiobolus disseminans TaxID=1469910 RepID=A0A6A6ZW32_9PLEO|nr:hypothetical protein CC86DRAFT_41131 [Ophiobolus disseminans]